MTSNRQNVRQEAVARRLREHAAKGDVSIVDHVVQVTSYGGSGTTALCDHLASAGLDLPKGPGYFPFKHQRRPPEADEVPSGFRAVYLYSDPRNAVLSIFRRGIQVGHYQFLRMVADPAPDVLRRLSSLDAFLDGGVDEFLLEDHVGQWLARGSLGYPLLAVSLESLDDTWPVVCCFLGLEEGHPGLPAATRGSDWRGLPRPQRDKLDEMYGRLVQRLESLPPVQVVG